MQKNPELKPLSTYQNQNAKRLCFSARLVVNPLLIVLCALLKLMPPPLNNIHRIIEKSRITQKDTPPSHLTDLLKI